MSDEEPGISADRRVQRTRQALRNAMLSLLPEKGWDELSVQDICDQANVGRSTFYVHFQSKEELLAQGLGELRAGLRQQIALRPEEGSGPFRFVHGLIEHMYEQRRVFRAIVGRRSGHIVQLRFREMLLQLVGEELENIVVPGWQREASAHYLAGALFELLSWSGDNSNAPSAAELEEHFQRLSSSAIQTLTTKN